MQKQLPEKQGLNQDSVYLDSDFLTKITLLQWIFSPSFPLTYEYLYHFETKVEILKRVPVCCEMSGWKISYPEKAGVRVQK